jgi:hypothetical protein
MLNDTLFIFAQLPKCIGGVSSDLNPSNSSFLSFFGLFPSMTLFATLEKSQLVNECRKKWTFPESAQYELQGPDGTVLFTWTKYG